MAKVKKSYIEHNGTQYDIPDGSSAEDVFESLKMAVSDLANCELKKRGNNWVAKPVYGELG